MDQVNIRLHPHALERLPPRGASVEEVIRTVREGETFPAKYGRSGFRRNFAFNSIWQRKRYATKQVEAYAVFEGDGWLVITVVTRYFEASAMKLTYDPRYNVAYIRLNEADAEVETLKVSEELNVDLSPDGRVFGIEFLNANEQFKPLIAGKLVLQNEATGQSVEVPLP